MFRISLDHQLIFWLLYIFGIRNGSVWFYCRMNHPLLGEGSTYLVVIGHGKRKCNENATFIGMNVIQCAPLSPRHLASFHSRNIAQLVSRMREIMTHGFLGWNNKYTYDNSDNDNSDQPWKYRKLSYLIHSYPTINQLLHKVAAKTHALTIVKVSYGPSPTLSWSDFMRDRHLSMSNWIQPNPTYQQ